MNVSNILRTELIVLHVWICTYLHGLHYWELLNEFLTPLELMNVMKEDTWHLCASWWTLWRRCLLSQSALCTLLFTSESLLHNIQHAALNLCYCRHKSKHIQMFKNAINDYNDIAFYLWLDLLMEFGGFPFKCVNFKPE